VEPDPPDTDPPVVPASPHDATAAIIISPIPRKILFFMVSTLINFPLYFLP